MATLETIQLEHVPSTYSIHVAVYKDVQNAEFLQQQLLSRNSEFEYAFIDATSVVSRLQVLAAVHKAIMIQTSGNMKTPNIHSEIVCSLSPNNNISEAYRRFGITPTTTTSIIIVKVLISPSSSSSSSSSSTTTSPQLSAETISTHLTSNIQGNPIPFTDATLSQFTDWSKIKKYYKLNTGVNVLDSNYAKDDEEGRRRELEGLVLSGMALRGL